MASITYRGATFTNNGSPRLKSVDGLDGWNGAGGPYPLAANHGGVPGAIFGEPKEFQLLFQLIGSDPSSNWTQRTTVRAAFNPSLDEEELLTLTWDGWPELQIACKPSSRGADMDAHSPLLPVRMLASDPVLYSTTLRQALVPVFAGSGGLTYDVNYDKDYGSAGVGLTTALLNNGDWESWPRFVITGPSTGTVQPLKIENVTDGTEIVFTSGGGLTIPAGSTLVVDTHPARRVVRFTDGGNRWNTVAGTTWWPIYPGGAELRFRATGTTDGVTVTAEVRDAYL